MNKKSLKIYYAVTAKVFEKDEGSGIPERAQTI